jgi:hypothetical protein
MNGQVNDRKFIGFPTKCGAQEAMSQLQVQISSGEYHEPAKTLFNDYIQSWLKDTYRYEVQLSSFEVAKTNVWVHLIPYFKETSLAKITAYEIDQLYAQKVRYG